MSAAPASEPRTANQATLAAALEWARAQLLSLATKANGGSAVDASADDVQMPPTMKRIALCFGLSQFEQNVLLLAAGRELSSNFAATLREVQGGREHPTLGLALAALPQAHWSALSPAAPLRRWRLVELGHDEGLMQSELRIDERILHHLTGVNAPDERLLALVEPLLAESSLTPSQGNEARKSAQAWGAERRGHAVVQLHGCDAATRRAVANAVAEELGATLFAISAADIPAHPQERREFATLWQREVLLAGWGLFVELDDAELRTAEALLGQCAGLVIVSSRGPLVSNRLRFAARRVPPPSCEEQRRLWRNALDGLDDALGGEVDCVIAQFNLDPERIDAVGRGLRATIEGQPDGTAGALWRACRTAARRQLDDLAQPIEARAGWDDLVLPAHAKAVLRAIATQVRGRATVYEDWGFAAKSSRGLGLSALFAGPSGTGKTMAAEVLANELELDLYRIDLASVVSKYIGETERNLRRVFDAAEASGAILLFDEADALFGKRSEVKDSHDRYANIEVSYLLQRMEGYRGLAILTTNLKNALDAAFTRRIRFVVNFQFPNAADRADIWRRVFPEKTPVEGIDPARLAQLNIPGGNIRNIALGAAFLAAESGGPVTMREILDAARAEYVKIEKPLTDLEIRGWI